MEKREEFINTMSAYLCGWSAKIAELEAKAKQSDGGKNAELYGQIILLKEKQRESEKWHKQLKETAAGEWENIRKRSETSWLEMKEAVDAADKEAKQNITELNQ